MVSYADQNEPRRLWGLRTAKLSPLSDTHARNISQIADTMLSMGMAMAQTCVYSVQAALPFPAMGTLDRKIAQIAHDTFYDSLVMALIIIFESFGSPKSPISNEYYDRNNDNTITQSNGAQSL